MLVVEVQFCICRWAIWFHVTKLRKRKPGLWYHYWFVYNLRVVNNNWLQYFLWGFSTAITTGWSWSMQFSRFSMIIKQCWLVCVYIVWVHWVVICFLQRWYLRNIGVYHWALWLHATALWLIRTIENTLDVSGRSILILKLLFSWGRYPTWGDLSIKRSWSQIIWSYRTIFLLICFVCLSHCSHFTLVRSWNIYGGIHYLKIWRGCTLIQRTSIVAQIFLRELLGRLNCHFWRV